MDLYRVLELTHEADAAAIRAAYRRLAKRYHPDVSLLPDAAERFVAITEAYEVLIDPVGRGHYDRTRSSPSPRKASTSAEARYHRYTQQRRQAARAKAETYGRMDYQRFDDDCFNTVAGYFVPKLLGCFGLVLAGAVVLSLVVWIVLATGLPRILIFMAFAGVIIGGTWMSVEFDAWHNRWRKARRMRTGR